eukprot:gene18317-13164_t
MKAFAIAMSAALAGAISLDGRFTILVEPVFVGSTISMSTLPALVSKLCPTMIPSSAFGLVLSLGTLGLVASTILPHGAAMSSTVGFRPVTNVNGGLVLDLLGM